MKIIQRMFIMLLTLILLTSTIGSTFAGMTLDASAESSTTYSTSSTRLSLAQLQAKFPENKYWNGGNVDSYTNSPCKCLHRTSHKKGSSSAACTCNQFWGSMQCVGFAMKILYDAYGQDCTEDWTKKTNPSYIDSVKPGDYIRYLNNGHSVVVVAVNGDNITVSECNWGEPCRINWTRTESKSHFKNGFTHIYVAPYELNNGTPANKTTITSVSVNGPSVTVKWNKVSNASTYDVYLLQAPWSWEAIKYSAIGLTTTEKTFTNIAPGVYAAFVITRPNADTAQSNWYDFEVKPYNFAIKCWYSYTDMGNSISSAKQGEQVYFCYRLFETNTNKNLDELTDYKYTVKLTVYAPNGDKIQYSYSNDDNRISSNFTLPGQYKGIAEVTGDINGSFECTINITAKTYTISYNANGGKGAPASQTKTDGQTLVLSTVKPTFTGYTFLGWSTNKNATSATYSPGGNVSANANTTLYAVWKKGCEGNNHKYDGGVITTQPTCTKTGLKTFTCSNCKATKTESVAATGKHTAGLWSTTKNASCTETGTKVQKCTVCGSVLKTETIAKLEHLWDSGSVTTQPTCVKSGEKTYTCSLCKSTKSESVPATGNHIGFWKTTKAATCTNTGIKEQKCATCLATIKTETIPALGHSISWKNFTDKQHIGVCSCAYIEWQDHKWNEGNIASAPSYDTNGKIVYKCTICSTTKEEAIPCLLDINLNGAVDKSDASAILQHIVGNNVEINEKAADINGDGKVTVVDAIKILLYLSGKTDALD